MAPIEATQRRFVQHQGERHGDEVLTLGRVQGAHWAVLYPDGSVRVVSTNTARCKAAARADVAWVMLPESVRAMDWAPVAG